MIETSFGPNGFERHIKEALEKGIEPKIYRSQRVSTYIDSKEDLKRFLEVESDALSRRFLEQIGLRKRLAEPLARARAIFAYAACSPGDSVMRTGFSFLEKNSIFLKMRHRPYSNAAIAVSCVLTEIPFIHQCFNRFALTGHSSY